MKILLSIILWLCIFTNVNSNHFSSKQYSHSRKVRVNNPNFLYNELQARLIPDADILTCIAVAESGYDLSNRIGKNNIFGITNICALHWSFPNVNFTYGQEYVDFNTMEDQLNFMEQWVYKNPRYMNEYEVNYIYRTGYNPYTAYYILLDNLYKAKIWEFKKEQQNEFII